MSTRGRSIATSLVGGAAELSFVALLHRIGSPALATFASVQLIGIAITFTLNKLWVFEAKDSGAVATELTRAGPVIAGAFAFNTVLPALGTDVMPAAAAYVASQVLVYLLWSFPLNRRWVFRRA